MVQKNRQPVTKDADTENMQPQVARAKKETQKPSLSDKSRRGYVEKVNISRMVIELARENSMNLNKVYNELAMANGLPTMIIPLSLYPKDMRWSGLPQLSEPAHEEAVHSSKSNHAHEEAVHSSKGNKK